MAEKKQDKIDIIKTIVLMAMILVAGVVIWLLTNKSESYTSTSYSGSDYSTLECTSSSPEDPFFVSATAQRFTHTIKIMFTDDYLKEMSYRYDGTYDSTERAENAEAWLHADYNKYMVANGLNSETLNPVFSIYKSKLDISLYAEVKKLNSVVARLFFIGNEDFSKIGEFKSADYKKFYEKKGFVCKKDS